MVRFFSSAQLVYFNLFFCLPAYKLFLILDHTKSYDEEIHSTGAELAEDAHKLHVKLQSLCGSSISVSCAHACQALSLRSELTNKTS